MTELQTVILDIFKQFKRICEENCLTYYAIGGTCIGAVRHHGFIPWDDDLDVAMPLLDYEKFQEIAATQLRPPYSLYKIEGHPHWQNHFIKLQNDDTSFFEPDAMQYPDRRTGVYMDIMPLYGMPKGKAAQFVDALLSDYYLYANRKVRVPYSTGIKRAFNIFFNTIRTRKGYDFFVRRFNEHFSKYPFDNSDKILFGWRERITALRYRYTYKTVFNRCDFQSFAERPFEDTTIAIPSGYDNYLRRDFGDYMTLPPVKDRIPRHTAFIDLHKGHQAYGGGAL